MNYYINQIPRPLGGSRKQILFTGSSKSRNTSVECHFRRSTFQIDSGQLRTKVNDLLWNSAAKQLQERLLHVVLGSGVSGQGLGLGFKCVCHMLGLGL